MIETLLHDAANIAYIVMGSLILVLLWVIWYTREKKKD